MWVTSVGLPYRPTPVKMNWGSSPGPVVHRQRRTSELRPNLLTLKTRSEKRTDMSSPVSVVRGLVLAEGRPSGTVVSTVRSGVLSGVRGGQS